GQRQANPRQQMRDEQRAPKPAGLEPVSRIEGQETIAGRAEYKPPGTPQGTIGSKTETQKRQSRYAEEDGKQRATLGRALLPAKRRSQNCHRQRKEEHVHQDQRQPPHLAGRHTANNHANGQARKHGQQTIKRRDPFGRELTERDIVPAQIRQEQKSQRSFASLPADAIGG